MIAHALVVLLCGCSKVTYLPRVIYKDPATEFSVRFDEGSDGSVEHGERGEIHPAVLEYILASPESPLVAYYDLVLGLPVPPPRARRDLDALAADARTLAAGQAVTGRHYARALVRRRVADLNQALAKKVEFGIRHFEGTAALWWGDPADLEANVFQLPSEREAGGTELRTVIYRQASIGVITIRSSGTDRLYAWDVLGVPGAFDPKAALDVDTVARQIVALHVYTTPPRLPEAP